MILNIKKIKNYSEEFLTYGVSQLFTILIPIILIPILTRTITPEDFANYSMYKSLLVITSPFIGMGFSTYLIKYYYIDLKKNYYTFFYSVFIFSLITSFVLLIIVYLLKNFLLTFLKFDDFTIIIYVVLNTFLLSHVTLVLTLCRARRDKHSFLILNIIIFIFTIIPVLILFYQNSLTLTKILLINSFSFSSALIYSFFKILVFKNFSINSNLLFKSIKFSLPLILYQIFAQIYIQGDKFIINAYLSKEELAYYYAIFQVCFGISAFGNILQLTWSPHVFKIMAYTKKIPHELFRSIILVISIAFIFSFIYFLFMPFFQHLLLPLDYHQDWSLYIWFVIGLFFQIIWWILNPFLNAFNKNNYFVYITCFAAIISI
jgi:O-antigen/teichoic acid export membrane protein